jgi:microcystin-dependent protein
MNKIKVPFLAVLSLLALLNQAYALSDSNIPTKIPTIWATSAPGGNVTCPIPIPTQTGISPGRASWTDGFPPITFLPAGAGGIPPFGQDFNGVLCQISGWVRWANAGGPVGYDNSFSTSIGGYPKQSVLTVSGVPGAYWFSQVDNNTSNPDAGGANWLEYSPIGATARTISASGAFAMSCNDSQIGIIRTVSPAASSAVLPTCSNAATIEIQDLAQNFNLYPVTISPPGGQTIAGQSSVILALNGQTAHFTYYPSASTWGCDCLNVGVPVGSIQIAAYGTADAGYLITDGSCVSATKYPNLYSKIGTAYGTCTAGNFGLPDLRGRVPAGQDNMGGTAANRITSAGGLFNATALGASGGVQSKVVNQANLAAFSLPASSGATFSLTGHVPLLSSSFNWTGGGIPGYGGSGSSSIDITGSISVSTSVSSGGSGTPLPTLSPTQIVMYEIKF